MDRQMRKKEFFYTSTDKIHKIHAVMWVPDHIKYPAAKGIVQISHGMVEYIERYDELARRLNERGFIVTGNDHLGHGKSVRTQEEWGYFTSNRGSAHVVADMHRLSRIVKKQFPDKPYYLLGHSMGSFMARRYMMTYGRELDGAILMGTGNPPKPLIIGGLAAARALELCRGRHYRSEFLKRLMFGSYNCRVKNPKTDNDWVCSDEKIMEAYNKDPACTFLFTVNG